MRAMGGSIANWPALLRQAYENLCPGGWIELSDFDAWASTDDDSLPATSSYHEFQVRLDEAAKKFGRVMNVGPLHKQNLIEAGFVDVVDDRRKVCGPSETLKPRSVLFSDTFFDSALSENH